MMSKEHISELKADLAKDFKLQDLGPTSFLLGVAMDRDRSECTLSLSQCQYILDLLQRFNFSDCSPVATPMDPGLRLSTVKSLHSIQIKKAPKAT